jgi:uncharacterized protein (TIGR04141 family)
LIKEGLDRTHYIIKPDPAIKHQIVKVGEALEYDLFIRTLPPKLPGWARFFEGYVDPSVFGDVRSTAAVLLIPVDNRIAALTFGQGRHLLADDCWEERFGLRVVLNSVNEGRLRSIDKQTFDAVPKHAREQTSRDAFAFDFSLDIERDLVRAVTGALDDETLGRMLTGMDALKAQVRTELARVEEPISLYVRKSQDESYKTTFPWVDYLAEVRDGETAALLDMFLVDRLRNRDLERCWMAAPDLVEWPSVRGFRYSPAASQAEYHDIHLQSFLAELKDPVDRDLLSRRKVYCIGDDDQLKHSWSVYRCIYCEIDHGEDSYLLSGGSWYQVARNFVQEVNQSFNRIERVDLGLPEYQDGSEGRYLQRVHKAEGDRYALMDQKFIAQGPVGSKVEFCDLFSRDKEIIHVKRYGSASVLSHLFSQGLVSGDLLFVDPEFRGKVRELLPDSHREQVTTERPSTPDFKIIFAIISQSTKPLSLPFFSRLSLRHAARRLEGFGYKVALAKIEVEEEHKKIKKFGSRTRRR